MGARHGRRSARGGTLTVAVASPPVARFFKTAAALRRWLTQHAETAPELWIEFYTKGSGKGGLTYTEAVEESLCFGWIDGVRRKTSPDAFIERFSPRVARSKWSVVNLRRFDALRAADKVTPRGLEVFEARDVAADGFSIAARPREIDPTVEKRLRGQKQAWAFFEAQPPWYQRAAAFWVMDAKQETTRERRLATLIDDSAAGQRIRSLSPAATRASSPTSQRKTEG